MPCSYLSGHCHCLHAFPIPAIVPSRAAEEPVPPSRCLFWGMEALPPAPKREPIYDPKFLQQPVMCLIISRCFQAGKGDGPRAIAQQL